MRKRIKIFLALILFLAAASCVTTPSKKTSKKKEKTEVTQAESQVPDQDEAPSSTSAEELPAPVLAPKKPKTPKVGLILGPGGLKTFAHLGVLKEFEKAKIPIDAIVGLEMATLPAAFYALNGSANEAEWKLFKLKEDELFEKSFFNAKDRAASVSQVMEFVKRELGQRNHESFKVPFSCLSFSTKEEKIGVNDNGNALQSIKTCLPYPPLFKITGNTVASVSHIKKAAEFLREQNIDVVVLVNVIASGKMVSDADYQQQPALANLWLEIKKQLREAESSVDYTITVDTKNFYLNNFEMRRAFVQTGGNDGRYHLNILSNKYGF
ncbi:MAG: hypothetical protein SGJ18_06215 [Pseudomonadota bacterium]|nr:hypothetical protein [Pseudomonadota bacterium]